jgi:hypothetical protein
MEPPTVLPVHHGRAADRRRGRVIKLSPEARSVPSARAHVIRARHDWRPAPLADDAALVVSGLGRTASPSAECVPRGRGVPGGGEPMPGT